MNAATRTHDALCRAGEQQRLSSLRDPEAEPDLWPASVTTLELVPAKPLTRTCTRRGTVRPASAPARGLLALVGLSVPLWGILAALCLLLALLVRWSAVSGWWGTRP